MSETLKKNLRLSHEQLINSILEEPHWEEMFESAANLF